jgi:predicted ATP-binding protein involved in virulence
MTDTLPGFHISKLEVNNFRCFNDLAIDFDKRLTVIVAENGGGKTAVLDAISIVLGKLVDQLTTADVRLRSGVDLKDTDFRRIVSSSRGRIRTVSEEFTKAAITCDMNGTPYAWDVRKSKRRGLKHPGIHGTDELKALAAAIIKNGERTVVNQHGLEGEILFPYLPVFAYYGVRNTTFGIPKRILHEASLYEFPLSAYLGCLKSGGEMKEFLSWFDQAEMNEFRENRDQIHPEEPFTDPSLNAVREALEIGLSQQGKQFQNPRFAARPKRFCIDEILPDNQKLELEISQLSDGYARILTIIMDYARRLGLANQYCDAVSAGGPGVMLIDEIDLHLHPSWQQRVLPDLMRVFTGTQFIVTTHSPQVLTTVKRENIRMLAKTPSGKWEARMPDRNPYAHANSVALETVMGGQAYPPSETLDQLREYQRLVGSDQHDSPRAIELRTTLEAEWGQSDPELALMDITIRKNETFRKLRSQRP